MGGCWVSVDVFFLFLNGFQAANQLRKLKLSQRAKGERKAASVTKWAATGAHFEENGRWRKRIKRERKKKKNKTVRRRRRPSNFQAEQRKGHFSSSNFQKSDPLFSFLFEKGIFFNSNVPDIQAIFKMFGNNISSSLAFLPILFIFYYYNDCDI